MVRNMLICFMFSAICVLPGSVDARPKKGKVKKAPTPSCEATALKLIKAGYNEGGMKVKRLMGPFIWNEAFVSPAGDPGLRHRIAFVVRYGWDKAFKKKNKPGTVLLIGECEEGEPSKLIDINKDKIVDLSDLKRVDRSKK